MSITYHERPGVYSDYTASRVTASGGEAKVMAIVGRGSAGAGLYTVTALADGLSTFGTSSTLGRMLQAAYNNGAGTVLVYCLTNGDADAYRTAFSNVLAERKAALMCVDSDDEEVQLAMRDAIVSASGQKGECIGIVGMEEPSPDMLLLRASDLDCERMVLVGPDVYISGEDMAVGGHVAAAALCGLLAGETDPALPLNGAQLTGFSGVTEAYDETTIDALVQGGVTVLEAYSGQVKVLRGITSKQTVGEGKDTTWREMTTILIADDVIPGIRNALAARFPRAKNNAVTRGAIRSLVIMELESRLQREIIDSYENVTVEASSTDATICEVKFGFTVTHGLNRIHLTAHISV